MLPPEWFKELVRHGVDAPVKIVQAIARTFPKADHYRVNLYADGLAAAVFVVALLKVNLSDDDKTVLAIAGLLSLLFFFAWCFKTSRVP
jgi:hypothetical protein